MRNSFIAVTNARNVFALSLLLSAGCGAGHTGFIPSGDVLERQARIISNIVTAGGRSYVIDQMYTPYESNLVGITSGPRGLIWYSGDVGAGKSTTSGDMSEFLFRGYATSIAEGPDQNLWVTLYPGAIGRVTTSGHFTVFSIPKKFGGTGSNPVSILNGPDKALWFVTDSSTSYIMQMTPAGIMKGYRVAAGSRFRWLTSSSDGSLWFTDFGTNKIGRMSTSGAVREFSVPTGNAGLSGICQGPDGNFWFIEQSANKVGRVSSSGSFREYDIPTASSGAIAIVAGPDGALWFTEETVGQIGRVSTSGKITELKLSGKYPSPYGIVVGSDKNLWFTESQSYGILGRVDLHEIPGSDPVYSEILLSLGKSHPQLGVSQTLPLSIAVENPAHHVLNGRYPNPIHLTTSNTSRAPLSATTVTSSTSKVNIRFAGHYVDATISANARGGGTISPAILLPSAPREKELPFPGYGLTSGPTNSLWICLVKGSIARYSMSGALHVYHATTTFKDEGCSILEGPDGNVWFTDYSNNRIGRITPLGHVTFFYLGSEGSPLSMALGSDGAFWFTEYFAQKIGRLTTAGQLTTYNAASLPLDIVSGSDGNLWYNAGDRDLYKLTTAGKTTRIRNVHVSGRLWAADHNLWLWAANEQLEELSTAGKILGRYSVPQTCMPSSITSGPEDSIWYVDPENHCVARMTLSGKFSIVPTYSQKYNPLGLTTIVVGPNGDLWFTETGHRGLGWIDPKTI